jgi:hypothetical protein
MNTSQDGSNEVLNELADDVEVSSNMVSADPSKITNMHAHLYMEGVS